MGERRDGNSRRPERGAPFRFSSIFEGKRTLHSSYLFLVDFWKEEEEEKEFRSITKYIKKNLTAIRTRRWESFEVIRRSYSYSLCSPRIPDCFPFQFLFLPTHYIRPWDRFSNGIFLFLLPLCFFFLLRSRINFDGRFDWKTFHAHLSEYEAGEGRNTNTSSVHVLLSCKAHFYGRAFINGTDICSAIDILVGPA